MRKKYTLIMPMLSLEEDIVPIEYQYDKETGVMNCIRSLKGIDTSLFSDVYFIILKKHNDKFNIVSKIDTELHMDREGQKFNVHYSIAFEHTKSQAETVYNCIKKYNIAGPIFIKDADNMCVCDKIYEGNTVLIYPLENTPVVDPQHKSYINIDEQNFVTNIIEKRVISGMFNCGGYSFADANDFIEAYDSILKYEDKSTHMYISHIIYWLILNKQLKFRPIVANFYDDFSLINK